MSVRIHCDNQCGEQTLYDVPAPGWRKSEPLSDVRHLVREFGEVYFCGFACEAEYMSKAAEKFHGR